jgi:hypothetical protein
MLLKQDVVMLAGKELNLFRSQRGFVVIFYYFVLGFKCKISEIFGAEKFWNNVVTELQFHQLEAATSDIIGQGLMTWETYGYIGYLCTTNLLVIILMSMQNLFVLQDSPYFRPVRLFIKFYIAGLGTFIELFPACNQLRHKHDF